MSKQLIKILCICALVVICPLVIVGVSLLSTEAVGYTLTISDAGVEKLGETDFGGKTSSVKIMVDGKEQKSNKVTLTNKTVVTVTYEGEGYDFVGWYNGNYNEINRAEDTKVSTVESYTFEITKNTVLTAVRDIKTYNVTFNGQYDDETTSIDVEAKTYEYNEPLAVANAKSDKKVLAGWHEVVDGSAEVTTKVANFANSGEVVLYPQWERQYKFDFYGVANYDFEGDNGNFAVVGTKNGVADQYLQEMGSLMYFMENPTEGYADLNQNVCDYFSNQYTNLKTMNGDDVVFTNTIKIFYKVNESLYATAAEVDLNELNDGVLSFGDVLEYVRTAQGSLDNVLLIDITFIYELV